MEQANQDQHAVHRVKRGRPPKTERVETVEEATQLDTPAQRLAKRIFDGQSSSLPMVERLIRVQAGLASHGYSMEGISLE